MSITTTPECTWSAASEAAWLSGFSPSSGQGSAEVQFHVAVNPSPSARDGDVVVNNERARVRQEAAPCRIEIAPQRDVSASGVVESITVTTLSGCPWVASSDASWISVAPRSGTGTATLSVTIAANGGASRTGTVSVGDQVLVITQGAVESCSYAISPTSQSVGVGGGIGGPVLVATTAVCSWTAVSNASWIAVTSGGSGSGNGSVAFSVAANTGSGRTGTLALAGQTFTVTQAGTSGCSYAVTPTTQTIGSSGGVAPSVQVSTSAGCTWTASSNVSWLTVVSGASGSGSGTVTYEVAANSGNARTATLTVAGQAVTVTQSAAAPCLYAISPSSHTIGAGGGSGTPITLVTGGACPWSAAADAPWITITSPPAGSGGTTITYTVAPNTGAERRGVITVADQSFSVMQAGAAAACTYSVEPATQSISAAGGEGTIALNTASGCTWTASSAVSWITLTPTSGSGAATVVFTVAANPGGARSAVLTVAGQSVTISQAAPPPPTCTSSIAPTSQSVPAEGGGGTVSVSTASNCSWSATSNAPWITVTSGQTGTGAGTVAYTASPNDTGAARTGTLTIAGQTFTVSQAPLNCTYSISRTTYRVDDTGDDGPPIAVKTAAGCPWTAMSNVTWITITAGTSGTGPGTVRFTVAPNDTGERREGILTIAGQTLTVTQAKD